MPKASDLLDRILASGNTLTFDEVDMVPAWSDIAPNEPFLTSRLSEGIELGIPIIGAPMATSASPRGAVELARRGGIYFLDRNRSLQGRIDEIQWVKNFRRDYVERPVVVPPTMTVAEVIKLQREPDHQHFKAFPVVCEGQLLGVSSAGHRKVSFNPTLDLIKDYMMPFDKLVVGYRGMTSAEACKRMRQHVVNTLPIVVGEEDRTFCGIRFLKPHKEAEEARRAGVRLSLDSRGRFLVGAAVSVIEAMSDIEQLLEAKPDAIVVDVSHGHTEICMERIRALKPICRERNITIVSGNIVTEEAAEDMITCGADTLRTGYGSGGTCISTLQSGFGMRLLMAVHQVQKGARGRVPVIADGGLRSGADLAKAIGAGADVGMFGTYFGGTDQAPGGEPFLYNGMLVKPMEGNGSSEVMLRGGADRYEGHDGFNPLEQGGSGVVSYRGPIGGVIEIICAALKLALATNGSRDLKSFRETVQFLRRSAAGAHEAGAHGITIIRSARLR